MTDRFKAVIVGGGPAGSTAAYLLAKAGLEVLLVERGESPGSKNMFGGRMYSYALARIIPGFWEEAPLERPVVREMLTVMNGESSVSVTCQEESWGRPPHHSYTLLRAEFDAWLAAKAEEAGALIACSIRIDDLLLEKGKVVGVRAGDDEIFADVVIAADGANSLLAEKAGLGSRPRPNQVAVGAKQIIELPADTISQRFGLAEGQGAAGLYVGSCTKGMPGGGFLYTNKESISLGLVVNAGGFEERPFLMSELVEEFKAHPIIAPLVEGGRVAEYSAHLVPEAGLQMTPQLVGDGILVAGDAAGMVLNLGYQVRGIDLAIASGEAAAQAVIEAEEKNDFSRQGLGGYRERLKRGVLRDMEFYRNSPRFLENRRLYLQYPQLATGLAACLFTVDGSTPRHLLGKALNQIKSSGIGVIQLLSDAWKGGRWL